MVPKLSSVLAELVYELAKAAKEESPQQQSNSLSVRIKTYQSLHSGQQLLCHFKVSSSCRLPVLELLREQKLSELAHFLLHVQQESEDCHCVLVRTVPDQTKPESQKTFLTSSESLTVTQEQGDGGELCLRGETHGDEDALWTGRDSCGSQVRDGEREKDCKKGCQGKVEVASTCLGESSSSADAGKEGAHLHIRFSAEKLYILEEGKVIHDFLHQLKLFHPTIKLSFVLSIDEQVTRASYRFQGFTTIQGHPVITDPKYFSRKSSLTSQTFWGCGMREVFRGHRCARALCLACHVTHCQPLVPAAARANCHGSLSVYGPYGVPSLKTDMIDLMRKFTTEINWQQFGMKITTLTSCIKAAVQLVHEVLEERKSEANAGGGDVCGVVTAALMDLYQHPSSDPRQQQPTFSCSHLDKLLPLISKSVAEIYTRSDNQHFRECMQLMTQADSGQAMESVLRQELYSVMGHPIQRGHQTTNSRPPVSAKHAVIVSETFSQNSLSAQFPHPRLPTPGVSAGAPSDLECQQSHRASSAVLGANADMPEQIPSKAAEIMDNQGAEEADTTSADEENWFSQMEQELAV